MGKVTTSALLRPFTLGIVGRIVLVALVCAIFSALQTRAAFATQAKVPTDWSFYVNTTDTTTAYTLGCNQGHFDASFSPPINSMVVLDFGGQYEDGSGTQMIPNGPEITNAQIQAFAENFAKGYWTCTGADTTSVLQLGIGTNNSYYGVDATGGTNWQNQVLTIRNYVQSQGWNAQVNIGGANDLEPAWHNYQDTKAWVDALATNYPSWYVDYGTCDGCSQTAAKDNYLGNGWYQHSVYYVAWQSPPAYATPEIYVDGNQREWYFVSRWGAITPGTSGKILFWGPLDGAALSPGDYSSTDAWNVFWNQVNRNSRTATNFTYSAEIHYAR